MVVPYKLLLVAQAALAGTAFGVWVPYLPPDQRKGRLGFHINLERYGNAECASMDKIGETTPVSDESGCMTWGMDPGFGGFRYNWMRGGIGNHPLHGGTCVFGVWANQGCRGNYIGTVQDAESLMNIGALKSEWSAPGMNSDDLGSCVRVEDQGLGKAKSLKLICSVHHKHDFTPEGVPPHDTIHFDKFHELWDDHDEKAHVVLLEPSEKEQKAHENDDEKKFSTDIDTRPMTNDDTIGDVKDKGFPEGSAGYPWEKSNQWMEDWKGKGEKRAEVFVA